MNSPEHKHSIGPIYICLLSILLLFPGFFDNHWRVADQGWFLTFQNDIECLVLGRMVKSRQDGILSDGGLLGMGSRTNIATSDSGGLRLCEYQYAAYNNFLPFKRYTLYQSHMGLQGLLFSLFDKSIYLSQSKKINLFYSINSFLSTAVITMIMIWFYLEFNLIVFLCVLASTIFSPWLVVFGKNLYWCLWVFYLPIIATMYILHYCDNKCIGNKLHGILAVIIFISFFVKCATGYEYITTVMVMTIVPLVYYALLNQWNFQTVVKRFVIIIWSCFLAVFTSLAILCCQIYLATGSFMSGVNHIILSFMKRTYKIPLDYPPLRVQDLTNSLLARSFEADLTTVLSPYFTGTFFDISSYINALQVLRLPVLPFFSVRYVDLIVLFLGATAYLLLIKKSARHFDNRRKLVGVISATWFSILAPLSWFIIFKAHSFIHTHVSFIVWHMPFTIFGFALCGLAAEDLLFRLADLKQRFSGDRPTQDTVIL